MILVGQDLVGGWAWIILDREDRLVASGDGMRDRFLAVDVACAVYRGMAKRGEADLDPALRITFPDEYARP